LIQGYNEKLHEDCLTLREAPSGKMNGKNVSLRIIEETKPFFHFQCVFELLQGRGWVCPADTEGQTRIDRLQ